MTHYAPIPPCDPGVGVTLYDGSTGLGLLTAKTVKFFTAACPDVVQIHCGPGGFDNPNEAFGVGTAIRLLNARVRLWWGIGVDGLVGQVERGELAAVERQVEGLARNAKAQGIELVMWDQEAAGEGHPTAAAVVARTVVKILRDVAPKVLQGFTSYDHPVSVARNAAGYPARPGEATHDHFGGHGRLPWEAWLGPGGVDLSAEQTYVATNPAEPAKSGSLRRRQATSNASFAMLERQGRMRPGMPRVHYNQLWGVSGPQTVNCELDSHLWCGWAAPVGGRCDLQGRLDVLAACELRRRGVRSVEGLKVLQRELGVTADGVVGPVTCGALGIHAADWA